MGTFSSKYHRDNTKLHEKLSNAAGVEINHLIIMKWFNHILVYYMTILNVLWERFSPFHNGQWYIVILYDLLLWIKHIIINMTFSVLSLSTECCECWMSKWMNEYQWEICMKIKCDCLKVTLIQHKWLMAACHKRFNKQIALLQHA